MLLSSGILSKLVITGRSRDVTDARNFENTCGNARDCHHVHNLAVSHPLKLKRPYFPLRMRSQNSEGVALCVACEGGLVVC